MNTRKKVLFSATVTNHILSFHIPYLKLFYEMGYEVHVASNGEEHIPYCDKHINISFQRSPFKFSNLKAYYELKDLISTEKYALIHCHTPMGGVLTRLATKSSRKLFKTTLIYTAHGFHFFKGAPLKNWLIYYPVEKWLSRYTDVLITINQEDYERAKREFKAKRVEYIPGVGIDLEKFSTNEIDRDLKRSELGLPKDAFVVLSVGELNKNKNHEVVIRAIAKIDNSEIHYVICGQGQLEGYLKNLSKDIGIENQVHLLGFRKDIADICKISDLFAFPSYREGLSVALMEAMATGLPLVVTDCRGNRDLVTNNENGYIVEIDDVEKFAYSVEKLYLSKELRSQFRCQSLKKIQMYKMEKIMIEMVNIYTWDNTKRNLDNEN